MAKKSFKVLREDSQIFMQKFQDLPKLLFAFRKHTIIIKSANTII